MSLKIIRLELASTASRPHGHRHCGYVFTAPLDAEGRLDPEQWVRDRADCTVRRFWDDERDEHGVLMRHIGRWSFCYEPGRGRKEEPISFSAEYIVRAGEYVTVTEDDGIARLFRVASVQDEVVRGAIAP